MPNTLGVLVNLAHAVKGNSMDLPFQVGELEGLRAFVREGQFLERYQDNAVLCPIVASQLEISFRELRVPSDAVQQFLYRDHAMSPVLAQKPLVGFKVVLQYYYLYYSSPPARTPHA
jgi:hypothetical protein